MTGYTNHPGPVTLSNGIKVEIDEFPQNKFTFLYIRMDSEVGGALPHGELSLRCIEEPAMDKKFLKTNFFKVTIEQEDPVDKYEIRCHVVRRDWSPEVGVLLITFLCVPETDQGKSGKFFSKANLKSFKQKNLGDIIKEVWGDSIRWDTNGNCLGPEDWYQDRVSDLEFLAKLCTSIQKNTLFAFDFEGLIIKDILGTDRVTKNPEPDRKAEGYATIQPIQDKIAWNYMFRTYRPIENPCTEGDYKYGREISKNFRLELHEDDFRIYRADQDARRKIYGHNRKLISSGLYGSIKLRYEDNLPPLRLMDTIKYTKANESEVPNMSTFMVWRVHLFLSGDQSHRDEVGKLYSTEFELCSIQDVNGNILPDSEEQDPNIT